MDIRAVLSTFDDQMRRHVRPGPQEKVERDGQVMRIIASADGWSGVVWSDLSAEKADTAIARQINRFSDLGQPWEWKLYSYDRPLDLAERLEAAGLTAGPVETVLVAEIADLAAQTSPTAGVELVPVIDVAGVNALVQVHDEVFGGDHSGIGRTILSGLGERPSSVEAVVAMSGGSAVCAGRVEFCDGTDFASLWGGGTLPAWRGRGVFRSLVAYRADLARARGFRYVQVDATPESRPILKRLGFVELATTTPYTHPGHLRAGAR
jgi:GNAT superfamily N-acetyltransferase